MKIDQQTLISRLLERAHSVTLVSHLRPDGDAVGCLLGLGLSLKAAGKTVQMVLADGVPSAFRHLPGSECVVRHLHNESDLIVVLDASDLDRCGGVLGDRVADINIDHHVTNLQFARVNLVDPEAAATSEILAANLSKWNLPINHEVAVALLTGIVSDTLGFRTSSTTSQSLRLAAEMMEQGANLAELYHLALVRRSFESALYWGAGLSRLQREGQLIWTSLTLSDRERASYSGNDDADLVNLLSTIDDAEIMVIFVEQKGGKVKISWRAQPGWDISKIAVQFGGGGHPAAAGAEIIGDLSLVQEKVLQATRILFDHYKELEVEASKDILQKQGEMK